LLTAVDSIGGFAFPNTVAGDAGSALLAPNFQFTVVPEPSLAGLAFLSGSAVVWRRLIRRKK
jgi:hypothetical protein